MKKIITIIICVFITISFSACVGDKSNPKLVKLGLKEKGIQRIAITNNRYAGRYTIIDKKSIDDFIKILLNSTDVTNDSKLAPDFIFEVFDDTKIVATFKYIAGIQDSKTANLIDTDGNLYNVSTSIENEFMKRLMKSDESQNIPEYYTSLIKLLIEKANAKKGDIIVIDISKDYVVTRSITSLEQQNIFNSVETKGAKIVYPSEGQKFNYTIKINTSKYTDSSCTATASVKDNNNITTKYEIIGTYEGGDWNYHIKYK